ncbi:MAG: transporter, partial [Paenibacillus sp.]|nr:transporter [Paenibacillus sp.]
MWKLAAYIKPYWKAALMAPLLMLVEVFADLLQPRLMASIVDEGVMVGDLVHIQKMGALMLVMALIGLIGGVGCTIFSSIASQHFGADIRKVLFTKTQSFSYRNMDRFTPGSLIVRLTNDVNQVQLFLQMLLRIMVRAPFLCIGSLIMVFLIHWKLALILVAVIPLLFAVVSLVIRRGFPLFGEVQKKLDGTNTVLQENLAGIRVVKAFVRSDFENRRFGSRNDDYMATAVKANLVMAVMQPIMFLLLNGSIVAVLWFGGHHVWKGSLAIGELVAFINYVIQLLSSLLTVAMMMMNISRAKASSERINEVLSTESEIVSTASATQGRESQTTGNSGSRIEFDHVSFAYEDGKEVLRDISFVAEPGQTVAIVGATGSGKSTLVRLIPRLYEAGQGSVLIDGRNVKDLAISSLRREIAIVLQEAILFSGTITDNIRYGKPDAAIEEIEAAAKAAQAHDFIAKLPEGYDTIIGQRGVNLSGGQKQRISIARA